MCVCYIRQISAFRNIHIVFFGCHIRPHERGLSGYVVMVSTNDKAESGKTFLFWSVVVAL